MLREQAGWRERDLELEHGSSIEDAWRAIVSQNPQLAPSRDAVRFARNRKYASADEPLADGDELVLIPPVAGGAGGESGAGEEGGARGASGAGGASTAGSAEPDRLLLCELRESRLEDDLLAELRARVPTDADGALVIFVGQTRDSPGTPAPGAEEDSARHEGQRVTGLDYEAFDEMALDILRTIGTEIEQRFQVRRLAIIHRVGRVALGEPSVVIAAAAPHRAAAFEAARYAIEELKARAPIWKAEHYADGSVWVGAPAREGPQWMSRAPEGKG
jgi:molybdopterin synthase catalytic subunit